MNEAKTRAEKIDPLLTAAGWGDAESSRIHWKAFITPVRMKGEGRGGRSEIVDTILMIASTNPDGLGRSDDSLLHQAFSGEL